MNPTANPADFILAFAAAKASKYVIHYKILFIFTKITFREEGEIKRVDSILGVQQRYKESTLAQSNKAYVPQLISSSLSVPMPPAPPAASLFIQTQQCLARAGRYTIL